MTVPIVAIVTPIVIDVSTRTRATRNDIGMTNATMRNELMESEAVRHDTVGDAERERLGLPNRLLTAFDVARCLGCHEETVRRAYWRGLLRSQRFGVRGRRFHPHDVLDWLRRGAPTKNP